MTAKKARIHWEERGTGEQQAAGPARAGQRSAQPAARPPTPLLDQLGRDLTALAAAGRLGPIYGRAAELRQLLRILLRKQKNNPLIVGPAGVGKTALVEGLAGLLAGGAAPAELRGLRIVELAPASLTAGTAYRGALEARLQALTAEAAADPRLVVFIDEIHTLVRAGGTEGGALDIANLLKPALARGELRCIGATTPGELERFLRLDPAFERRFEPLLLEEPTLDEAAAILAAARPGYEAHHSVEILPEAVQAAVALSAEHLLERSLPDKAFDLLDNACALRRLPGPGSEPDPTGRRVVDAEWVRRALAEQLNLPVQKLGEDLRLRLAGLEAFLAERVLGQPLALARVAAAVQRTFAGLGRPDRPRAILAFFGGTGTGKGATARALAEFLFGSPEAVIHLDLSAYKEPHAVARLWGAPPGYVGYGEEGSFASRLRRQPFAVVLLDEIEKAHPEIQDAFLPILDTGRFHDARGRPVDARQAVFILASNLFSAEAVESAEAYASHAAAVRLRLPGLFRPEFVNRLDDLILFGTLTVPALAGIAARELAALNARLAPYGVRVEASPQALQRLAEEAYDPDSGARAVLRLVARQAAEPAGAALIAGTLKAGDVFRMEV